MEAKEIINQIRHGKEPSEFLTYFQFSSNNSTDSNLEKRTEIVEELLNNFSNQDIKLIRQLFQEEINCELAIQRHDNLYQICFYLYSLGNMEDVFKIYKAKYDSRNFDTATMLDREMLYVNHKIEEVVNFVKNSKSELKENLLKQLIDLQENPDYESEAAYNTFINGYFFGHQEKEMEVPIEKQTPEKVITNSPTKKWWEFWK